MTRTFDCRHRRKAAALAMVAPKSLARAAAAARLAPYLPVATARSAAGPDFGVAPKQPDGCRVIVALQCVACRRGEVSVCWQRKGWNEVALELIE